MTTQELAAIADAMRALIVDEDREKAFAQKGIREGVRKANLRCAMESARRFNRDLDSQRHLLELARAKQEAGEPVPDDLSVVLRAAAVLYRAERERIVERFGLRQQATSP